MYYVNRLKGKQDKLRIFIRSRAKVEMIKIALENTGDRKQIN